jgi:hypothetical protein
VGVPAEWFDGREGLAIGTICTSAGFAPGFPVTWDFLEVTPARTAGGHRTIVEITTPGPINASTYAAASIAIANRSATGHRIHSVRFDLRGAAVEDAVFDPEGTAGDSGAKPFTADLGGEETGFIGFKFGVPTAVGGYRVLDVDFNDFDAGETFAFSLDLDPTSLNRAQSPGPNEAGSISGLELTGATVFVRYDDGAVHVSDIVGLGESPGAGTAVVIAAPAPAPAVSVVGHDHETEVSRPDQLIRLTGTPDAKIMLLQFEGGLFVSGVPGGGYDLDPFEINSVTSVAATPFTLDASGNLEIPVKLSRASDDAGYNLFQAVQLDADGTPGRVSEAAIIRYVP